MELKVYVSTVISVGNKILFVREAKAENLDKWNLPGGSLEPGETLAHGAKREVQEETQLDVTISAFLGVYRRQSLRFVFWSENISGEPKADDNVSEVKWFSPQEIIEMNDESLVSAKILKQIMQDCIDNVRYPLSTIQEIQ